MSDGFPTETPVATIGTARVFSGAEKAKSPPERRTIATEALHTWLKKPLRSILVLAAIAFAVEFAQAWDELFPGAHALGELVRNLAYALVGALIFNWLLVEIPQARRRKTAYAQAWLQLDFLVKIGALQTAYYRTIAEIFGVSDTDVDAWDRASILVFAERIEAQRLKAGVSYFGAISRVQEVREIVQSVQVALNGLDGVRFYLDPDVSHALALFPGTNGFQQLQPGAVGEPQAWSRDAHIVWELLEAGRRLLRQLRINAPDIAFAIEGASGAVRLADATGRVTEVPFKVRSADVE